MLNPLGFSLLALLAPRTLPVTGDGAVTEDTKTPVLDTRTDDDKKSGDSIDLRLLEILHERGRIDDAEFARLKDLAARMSDPTGAEPQGYGAAPPKIKAEPGKGLTVESADGKYKLNVSVRLQFQWQYFDRDNVGATLNTTLFPSNKDSQTFSVRRARLILKGHAWDPKITYFFNIQPDEGTSIKDAWAAWEFVDGVKARIGQQKTQFSRIATGSSGLLEFVERDLVTKQFADSRARGLLFLGKHGDKDMINWHAGVFNSDTGAGFPGSGEERANPDNKPNLTAGVRIDPQGDMGGESYAEGDLERGDLRSSVGAGVWIGKENANNTATGANINIVAVNVNAAIKVDGWHGVVEFYTRNDNTTAANTNTIDSWGWLGQGSYTLAPDSSGHQLAFAGRIAQGYLRDNITAGAAYGAGANAYIFGPLGPAEGHFTELTAGVSQYYHGHALKSQLDFTYMKTDFKGALSDRDDFLIRFQFTINT